jgi:hypothetical protein
VASHAGSNPTKSRDIRPKNSWFVSGIRTIKVGKRRSHFSILGVEANVNGFWKHLVKILEPPLRFHEHLDTIKPSDIRSRLNFDAAPPVASIRHAVSWELIISKVLIRRRFKIHREP